ncbi:unnamed protein product, partial [Musa acuminata subsp. burmannicoides]
IVDFEPIKPSEVPPTATGALQSYKLTAKPTAKLKSLPGGSTRRLCNTVVEEVFELTGYDRVMVYRFHDDDHGEVLAEITKRGLDPYLGLSSHGCPLQYMETMNSISSLVLAVVVNGSGKEDDDDAEPGRRNRLWGLVVCHNQSPRFVPFPLRYAC